jgi:hypothetical protein
VSLLHKEVEEFPADLRAGQHESSILNDVP